MSCSVFATYGQNVWAALKGLLRTAHIALNYMLLVLFATHVLAALKHQFVERDGLLARMIPFLK